MRLCDRKILKNRAPRPEIDRRTRANAEVGQRNFFLNRVARVQGLARKRIKELGIVHPSDLPMAMALLAYKGGHLSTKQISEVREIPAWQKVAAVLALGAVVEGCGDFTPWELKEPDSNNDGEMADQLPSPDLTTPPPPPDLAVPLDGPDGGIPDQNGDANGDANDDASEEDGPTDGSDDMPDIPIIAMPDMTMQDTAILPDKAMEEPDLAKLPDLTVIPDLAKLPDLTPLPDLRPLPDLTSMPDLTKLPDLRPEPDLVPPQDLTQPPDLTRLPDLAQPPDLCGLITTDCEHIGLCGGNPQCSNGTDMKNALLCTCRPNCDPDGGMAFNKCICSTPSNGNCMPDKP